MHKLLLIAGLTTLAIPALVSAQPTCLRPRPDAAVAAAAAGEAGDHAAADLASGCAGLTAIGYYDDNGVWRDGPDGRPADGYYDRDGNWVAAAPPASPLPPAPPYAGSYGADVAYTGPVSDLNARESGLEQRIHAGDASGVISRGDAEHDFDSLAGIREFQARRASADGGLSPGDRADVMNKIDNLSAIVRSQADRQ